MDNETKDFFEALKLIERLETRIDKVLAMNPFDYPDKIKTDEEAIIYQETLMEIQAILRSKE